MSLRSSIPSWKLPPGVSRGTWDYLHSESIATEYDDYFAEHPLLKLDIAFIREHLPPPASDGSTVVADLGCGTGRVSRALSPLGFQLVNVDLSQAMLAELMRQSEHRPQNRCVLGNLVELDELLEPASISGAVCLFSSLGMIRGHRLRRRFLAGVRQALQPQGRLIVHAHNRYHSLWDPQGPAWLLSTRWKSWFGKDWEYGDRVYRYRGIPGMFLHIFSLRELKHLLREAGFSNIATYPINTAGDGLIANNWSTTFRAGGYFAVAAT